MPQFPQRVQTHADVDLLQILRGMHARLRQTRQGDIAQPAPRITTSSSSQSLVFVSIIKGRLQGQYRYTWRGELQGKTYIFPSL